MTREEYTREHYRRAKIWNDQEWQAEQRELEKSHVENFIKSDPIADEYSSLLEKCLLNQYWISAKSSPHQYTLMKDFKDTGGIEYSSITSAIGKYGFFGYYWCELHQYLILGDFYYWSSLYPDSWELINRSRIDTPPKEAYKTNFEGKWAIVGKPSIKSYPYPCNPYNGKPLDKNPFNGNPIREFNLDPEHCKFTVKSNYTEEKKPVVYKDKPIIYRQGMLF
ncbi:MAG: hypothetical protein FWH12_02310 [Treponema sp.]|nr:hypothetical protein [Treponema sp.]